MADYAHLAIEIYAIPEHDQQRVREAFLELHEAETVAEEDLPTTTQEAVRWILNMYGILPEDDRYTFMDSGKIGRLPTLEQVVPGARFEDDEARLGLLDEIGPVFEALEVSYVGWQDAKYEYDGEMRAFFPDLGSFDHLTNSNGSPHMTHDQVMRKLDEFIASGPPTAPGVALQQFRDQLDRELGGPWLARIESLRYRQNGPEMQDHLVSKLSDADLDKELAFAEGFDMPAEIDQGWHERLRAEKAKRGQ